MKCFRTFMRVLAHFQGIPMTEQQVRPMVFCGPSGSGKSTLVEMLMKEFPHVFAFCVSHTTRQARPGEVEGVHYFFTDVGKMTNEITEKKFIEHAEFGGNMYGTSRAAIEDVMRQGKIAILDIDTQGVRQVKESGLKMHYIFIKPPSLEVLKTRLMSRRTETDEIIQLRLDYASAEIEYGTQKGNFDLVIVNDVLKTAYLDLKEYVMDNVLTH